MAISDKIRKQLPWIPEDLPDTFNIPIGAGHKEINRTNLSLDPTKQTPGTGYKRIRNGSNYH